MADCVFCKISSKDIGAHTIWEDDKFIAFLDVNPVNPGHVLIIPREHISYIFDLEEPGYTEIFQVAKKLSLPLKNATEAKRIGLAIEGFGVDHLHLHLVPVNTGGELNPERAQIADDSDLVRMANTITSHISDL